MTLSGDAIFAVHLRLHDLTTRPRLFNERMTPLRVRARRERFKRWCGPMMWCHLCTYTGFGRLPRTGPQMYRRVDGWVVKA